MLWDSAHLRQEFDFAPTTVAGAGGVPSQDRALVTRAVPEGARSLILRALGSVTVSVVVAQWCGLQGASSLGCSPPVRRWRQPEKPGRSQHIDAASTMCPLMCYVARHTLKREEESTALEAALIC